MHEAQPGTTLRIEDAFAVSEALLDAASAAPDSSRPSAAMRVYQTLRQQIVDMVMLPGARINEKEIAVLHGTSRTPVHEAVRRLVEEGLVEVTQRVGTYVSRIPLDRLGEAMLVRTALEVAIVQRAALRIKPEDIARLRHALTGQLACVAAADIVRFHRMDEEFHEALAEIAGFPGVWRMIQQAKTQIDRYRRLTLPMPGRMDVVVAEHDHVVAMLEAGEAEQAACAMREHLDQVLPVLEIARMHRPEYFIAHLPDQRQPGPYW
ncbi:DNA-binding GntR family transcriptional regulator [Silvimonas terrae]|uniref:DNA-binding GntR family transcriptional regulator n=1 Tax=Silvimonas terrae TaxID=300266 RepID=A0A840RC88_9NEIS|nr:GntR family transcriptional regulator [Silvimonas terrae]MBB5189911.1 DNA-binding GntR family transcriptional regulator [Silvimonas terrae]